MLWKCSVCDMVIEGESPYEKCPKCGTSQDKFEKLSKEDSDKIYNADRTNDIHLKVIGLCSQIAALCEEGIAIDLDPTCITTFKQGKDEAWIIKQRCKTELAGHMNKKKW